MVNCVVDGRTTGPIRLSFSNPREWNYTVVSEEDYFYGASVKIGDPVSGATIVFFASPPGVAPPNYPAHGHASDSFRITVRGAAPTGEFDYLPGEFRLQEGWKPYGADNLARGSDGGWQMLMFADRRGAMARPVKADQAPPGGGEESARFLGVERGDIFPRGDERFCEPGPSGLAATLVRERPKHSWVNGSFDETDSWLSIKGGSKVAAALVGDVVCGPLVLLVSAVQGSSVSFGSTPLGTEVVQLVVSGSGSIDGETLITGDIRITPADVACPTITAGTDGVHGVIVFGDRRAAMTADPGGGEFAALLEPLVRELESSLPTPN
jgi:hypothetical protein